MAAARMKRWAGLYSLFHLCPALAGFLVLLLAGPPAHGATDTPAYVLVITGSEPYLPAFLTINDAMRAEVAKRSPRRVIWLHESTDSLRFGVPAPTLADLLARKYQGLPIEALVLASEPAVEFYLAHRAQLWPQAPALFHSVGPGFAQKLPADAGLSGLSIDLDAAGSIRMALALQPKARKLLVVNGQSLFDRTRWAQLRPALAEFSGRLDIEVLDGSTVAAVGDRLAGETLDTIVFYLSVMRDARGGVHRARDVVQQLSARSGTPIYGVFDSYMGHGLAGGSLDSLARRGERAGALLAGVLDGATAATPNADAGTASTSTCIADARQLVRFGLNAAALPPGCELRFAEPSFLQRYWLPSLLVGLALALQSLLIAGLLLQRRRRQQAEQGLQTQRAQLLHASRLAVAGELTASIAHEINQPLGAILSNADAAQMLLEAGRIDRDGLLQILSDIRRDDVRAGEVVKRLRGLLTRRQAVPSRVSLHRLAQDTAVILRGEARQRGIEMQMSLHAQDDVVLGDPVQLQQVLLNLWLNAMDACAALPAARRRIELRSRSEGAAVELVMRDHGRGFGEAGVAQVFEAFHSTKDTGMGLGLSIARSIVEAHDGTISAIAHPDGAEFRMQLPLAPDPDTLR
ncbi:MAG TPA: ATP-binding protein [Rubrivivax sp.]|nr:ATP-binding protein [Rubrivivax sp.]